jgi:hypothetical protein
LFKNSIKHVINVRHRIFRHAKGLRIPVAWAAYKQATIDCENAISKAKQEYYKSLVEKLSDYYIASTKWWSVITDITSKKKTDGVPFLSNTNNNL